MAATYELIASNTLGSAAASVTFSSIPATYTDLVVRWSARKDNTNVLLRVRFNSDATTLYSTTFIQGDAASPISAQADDENQWSSRVEISTDSADTFSSSEIYIPNYAGSQNKVGSQFDATENNSSTAYLRVAANLYRSTSAISSIVIDSTTGNLVADSSFFLYGIKNS